jgi:hypothetical protein
MPSSLIQPQGQGVSVYQQIEDRVEQVVEETFVLEGVGMVWIKFQSCEHLVLAILINVDESFSAVFDRAHRVEKILALVRKIPARPMSRWSEFMNRVNAWTTLKVVEEESSPKEYGVLLRDDKTFTNMIFMETDNGVGRQIQLIVDVAL